MAHHRGDGIHMVALLRPTAAHLQNHAALPAGRLVMPAQCTLRLCTALLFHKMFSNVNFFFFLPFFEGVIKFMLVFQGLTPPRSVCLFAHLSVILSALFVQKGVQLCDI